MDRLIDKCCVAGCCALATMLALQAGVSAKALVVAALLAVVATAVSEIVSGRRRNVANALVCLVALARPPFAAWLALAAYDLTGEEGLLIRHLWVPALVAACCRLDLPTAVGAVLACLVAYGMGVRTTHATSEAALARRTRDELREGTIALEEKNADLRDRQDQEARLATLAERSRIAREIHDNVGHLLTRSLLQVEALLVVHRDDEQVTGELEGVATTLREAMGQVRASVHDLRDDAFDLRAQLRAAAEGCEGREVLLTYSADEVPAGVGHCLASVAREALSNVARHSDGSRVWVEFVEYPGFWRLVVRDDGRVTPAVAADVQARLAGVTSAGSGMGLASMAERVRALGGVLRVTCDDGFKVIASVPKAPATDGRQ